ncbi:MAG: hypothetical protein JW857_00265 [Bacteroidales bacterium]|nr:hypothetical protein [Bacteroidales bacterium]
MIKKYTSILFIFLAGSIFFAHSIIPHHDNQNSICFYSTCEADGENQSKTIPDSSENKDGAERSSDDCILAKINFITDKQEKNHFDQFHEKAYSANGNTFQVLLIEALVLSNKTLLFSQHFIPFLDSEYTAVCITTFGLRAPPLA